MDEFKTGVPFTEWVEWNKDQDPLSYRPPDSLNISLSRGLLQNLEIYLDYDLSIKSQCPVSVGETTSGFSST